MNFIQNDSTLKITWKFNYHITVLRSFNRKCKQTLEYVCLKIFARRFRSRINRNFYRG